MAFLRTYPCVLLLSLVLFATCLPTCFSQTTGTRIPYQQTILSADRITVSPAQGSYRTVSGTQSFLSSDHALVQFNATTVTSLLVQWGLTLSNASATISFTGGSATVASSTGVFKFFDTTNTGGLTVTLDGAFNPTLSSSGTTLTTSSKLVAAHSIQISNSTGRLQFSNGDAKLTSVTQNFTFWDDSRTGAISMSLDGSKAGYMRTTGGNMTFTGGDFVIQTNSPTSSCLRVTDGTNFGNFEAQCYPDVTKYCAFSWNMRYTAIGNNPYFQRPNAAKSGYRILWDTRSTSDYLAFNVITGPANADVRPALTLDTSTPASPIWASAFYFTGPYAWRQVFTSGSGSVTIPSWVKVVYVTTVGAGGAGYINTPTRTIGHGGGGGGCVLNHPIVVMSGYSTMSYSVGTVGGAQSGSSTVTYISYTVSGAGGFTATSGGAGNGGGYTIGSTVSTAGGAGGGPGQRGTDSQPYFFPGGGGGISNGAGGPAGYIQGVAADANGFGAGGSSCLGMGSSGAITASGYGGGASGKLGGGNGYVEFFGLGGI